MGHDRYCGKVRLFARKTNASCYSKYEVADKRDVFDDNLLSDVEESHDRSLLEIEIASCGFESFDESIERILESYLVGDVVEIVANAHIRDTSSWTDCGMEYDYEMWLENEKHRKLTEAQMERFTPDFFEELTELEEGDTV